MSRQTDENDSGLDTVHVESIRDSANKLRSKMQTRAFKKHNQRIIDLNDSKDPSRQYSFQDLHTKREAVSLEQSVDRNKNTENSNSTKHKKDVKSPQSEGIVNDFNTQNYDSKITFSGEKVKNDEIRVLSEKLQQAENIILKLQDKIEVNMESYKERYDDLSKEIQELESDNIDLHQLVKSKMNEIQELKNENMENKRKILSHNMVNQKLSQTEEELQIKIEELMNKATELNFIIRKKDEEIQGLRSKNNFLQIDLNNAKNVEKSLNDEIQEVQKSREKLDTEFRQLKDEVCKLQVENRKFRVEIESIDKLENENLKAEISRLKQELYKKQQIISSQNINAKERKMVKNELSNLLKMHEDVEVSSTMNQTQKIKMLNTHEMIFDVIQNLINDMESEDKKDSDPPHEVKPISN